MAEEIKDELLGHDFDGIQEFDNSLPPWWLNMFYLCIVFAIVYYTYYHFTGLGQNQIAQYNEEVAIAKEQFKNSGTGENFAFLLKDQESLNKGAQIFSVNCTPCHGQHGEGIVGPNLTDKFWIHGPKFADMTRVITEGVPEKGMVTWAGVLKPEEIQAVASYIVHLQGSHPENPKDPQGTEFSVEDVGL